MKLNSLVNHSWTGKIALPIMVMILVLGMACAALADTAALPTGALGLFIWSPRGDLG